MPVQQMHAGEEVLWIVIPAFLLMMIVDIFKRRRLRREQLDSPAEAETPTDESPGPESAGEEERSIASQDASGTQSVGEQTGLDRRDKG